MNESQPDGWHENLLADLLNKLSLEDTQRLHREYTAVRALLDECPTAHGQQDTTEPDDDPPVRWSPWMRGQPPRCLDHTGHEQNTCRMLAKIARDADDPLWEIWHGLAEKARLKERTPRDPFITDTQ
jgi:hypothetical protein